MIVAVLFYFLYLHSIGSSIFSVHVYIYLFDIKNKFTYNTITIKVLRTISCV